MTKPAQPADPGTDTGVSPATNPTGTTPAGTPASIVDDEPMGSPNSDRAKTETAFLNTVGQANSL